MMAVGNNELGREIPDNAQIKCQICGDPHPIQYGISEGRESRVLAFFTCGDRSFVCGLAGRLLPGEELAVPSQT